MGVNTTCIYEVKTDADECIKYRKPTTDCVAEMNCRIEWTVLLPC